MLDKSSIAWKFVVLCPSAAKLTPKRGRYAERTIRIKTSEEIVKPTLAQYLASIRQDRKLSLRRVEELSEKEVSNAYLSQLETGKVSQPSPSVLHTLAEIYKIEYIKLMELAGYLPESRDTSERHGRLATFAEHHLTQEEEGELLEYLQFMRGRKR